MSKKTNDPSQKQVMRWFKEGVNGNIDSRIKYTNYWKNVWNKYSYNPGSTMIHEKDYETMNCCLCGKEMVSIHETHNPSPLTPDTTAKEAHENNLPHRCCGECNAKVVTPARAVKKGLKSGYVPVSDIWTDGCYQDSSCNILDSYTDMNGKGFG